MTNYCYCYYNRKAKFFLNPFVTNVAPEAFAQSVEVTIRSKPDEKEVASLRDLKVYFLGGFDIKTGLFHLNETPLEILDPLEIFEEIKDE